MVADLSPRCDRLRASLAPEDAEDADVCEEALETLRADLRNAQKELNSEYNSGAAYLVSRHHMEARQARRLVRFWERQARAD